MMISPLKVKPAMIGDDETECISDDDRNLNPGLVFPTAPSAKQPAGEGIRERLKRHREEVAGKVTIPEKWGKEELLKDWIDYSAFDRIFAAGRIASARESLVAQGQRRTASQSPPPLRVEISRC